MRALIASLLMASLLPLAAEDNIWAALVLSTNENPAREVPRKLQDFAPTIRAVFGYNSLYLLGQKKQTISAWSSDWLVPSSEFYFNITSLEQESACYRVRIELFRGKSLLLTTESRLARNAPLYIRGPQWGQGQLILLLEVR
jgi:hypothetical protein